MNTFGLTRKQRTRILSTKTAGSALRIMEYVRKRGENGATCEECYAALGLTKYSTTRFYELARAGCIESDGRKRNTKRGHAKVYVLVKDASFLRYLRVRNLRGNGPKTLTAGQRAILAVGEKFVEEWKSGGAKRKEEAAIRLVTSMGKAAEI